MQPINIVTILVDKQNSEGLCPVKLSIYIGKKRSYLSTGIRVKPEQWDPDKRIVRKNHPNSHSHNTKIQNLKNETEKKLIDMQTAGVSVSVTSIRRNPSSSLISTYANSLIKEIETKYEPDTISNFKFELSRILAFDPDATFDSVNPSWLRRYEQSLIKQGLANNTIHKAWKFLRKIFNSAIADKVTSNYPFKHHDNPKYQQTDRTFLMIEEVDKIEEILLKPITNTQRTVALYFLLGCYSGLRFSDWQRYNRKGFVMGDRLLTRTKKTGDLVSLKIHARLNKILFALDHLESELPVEQNTNSELKAIQVLAGLDKKLTTHVARHSFAVRCAELGISIETTAELMGITVRSCWIYYRITNKKIDAEVEKWNTL